MTDQNKLCTAKTLAGLEEVLAKELQDLGFKKITVRRRAVEFESDMRGIMRANLALRTALSIMYPVADFHFKTKEDLYKSAFAVPWEEWFKSRQTFSVQHTVYTDKFQNTTYPALILKDAIVDRFRNKADKRPNVDKDNPDIVVHLYISADHCVISLNSSGVPLYHRGYRNMSFPAPLNECLAAGLVLLSDWNLKKPLINPMCGSGTIIAEAAMIAHNIPANSLRTDFAFMSWQNYDAGLWEKVHAEMMSGRKKQSLSPLYASDISHRALSITKTSLETLDLKDSVELSRMDITKPKVVTEEGVLIINPPYGERIEDIDLNTLYGDIGRSLKFSYEGHSAWLISSNTEAIQKIGLRPSKKFDVFNGKLPCKYLGFELYKGSAKTEKAS